MQTYRCETSGNDFGVTAAEALLRRELAFHIAGQIFPLPPPRLCPVERQRRRLAFRNERALFRTTSALSGNAIVSSYSPDKRFKVVSRDEWLSLDNTQFGRDFDFSRPMFEQFAELSSATYKANVIHDGEMLNSDYCHFAGWSKNCYLTFDSGKNQECSYGALFIYCKDCYDCFYAIECELCYECVKVHNCYALLYSQYCENCSFSAFLNDCIGCKNCLCSTNLRNKEYFVFNEFVGKQEFERMRSYYFCGSHERLSELAERYRQFLLTQPQRALRTVNCEQSTGDLLSTCVDVHESFNCSNSRNAFHCHDCVDLENSIDVSMFGEGMQHCYELSGCGGARGKTGVSNCYFSTYVFYGGYNVLYSTNCHQNCSDLFACTDLQRKTYCILNKQYSQAEYEQLVPLIIQHMQNTGEWGEFFPMCLSPYGYNESVAAEFLPLEKAQALALGANWSDYQPPTPTVSNVVGPELLPQSVAQFDQFDLRVGIECPTTGKVFRLTKQEIAFYASQGLPLPRLHFEERQRQRSKRMRPRTLRPATCCLSGAQILTTVDLVWDSVICSEQAYLDVVL